MRACHLVFVLAIAFFFAPAISGSKESTVRWQESTPGCTFSRGDDGKYRYGLWTDDLGVTVAIDSQELQKSHRRMEPFVGILLEFTYRGKDPMPIVPSRISLEFASHSHVVHQALNAQAFSERYQDIADAAAKYNQNEIKKHPDKKELFDNRIAANEKELVEMQEFLGSQYLKGMTLSSDVPKASGWILFLAKDKWIGAWKQQEQFILRIPLEGRVFEFPFQLPPTAGDLILRKR